MKYIFSVLAISSILLAGCSAPKIQYAFDDVDAINLRLGTEIPNWAVDLSVSTSAQECESFQYAGRLFYDAQLRGGGLGGALQAINPIKPDENPIATIRLPPNNKVQLKANLWTNGAGINGRCGPIVLSFVTPPRGDIHGVVEMKNGFCSVKLFDAEKTPLRSDRLKCNR